MSREAEKVRFRAKLLQEELVEIDPTGWMMVCGCILLNVTSRHAAERVWRPLFERHPDADSMWLLAHDLDPLLRPLGLLRQRKSRLVGFSQWWGLTAPLRRSVEIASCHAPGVGQYAADSWTIFVTDRRPEHVVKDRELALYLRSDRAHRRLRP